MPRTEIPPSTGFIDVLVHSADGAVLHALPLSHYSIWCKNLDPLVTAYVTIRPQQPGAWPPFTAAVAPNDATGFSPLLDRFIADDRTAEIDITSDLYLVFHL